VHHAFQNRLGDTVGAMGCSAHSNGPPVSLGFV
jgi:hypothetical protein